MYRYIPAQYKYINTYFHILHTYTYTYMYINKRTNTNIHT